MSGILSTRAGLSRQWLDARLKNQFTDARVSGWASNSGPTGGPTRVQDKDGSSGANKAKRAPAVRYSPQAAPATSVHSSE